MLKPLAKRKPAQGGLRSGDEESVALAQHEIGQAEGDGHSSNVARKQHTKF